MSGEPVHLASATIQKDDGRIVEQALTSCSTRKIMLHRAFLEDEKFPEAERDSVSKEVFHRSTRIKQVQRLAGCLAPVLGGPLPANLLI